MPDKKKRHYHISLTSRHGEQLSDISVLADEIQNGNYPGSSGGVMTLRLEGEDIGKFDSHSVLGWWTTELAEPLEMPRV